MTSEIQFSERMDGVRPSAIRDLLKLGDGEIKTALEAVAANASPGNLGVLEGLSTRCLSN